MVKDKPDITSVLMDFTTWLEHQQSLTPAEPLILIAHNGNRFDHKILKRLITTLLPEEYQQKWSKWYFADTLGAIKQTHPEHKSNSLDNLAAKYISAEEEEKIASASGCVRHRALYDTILLRQIFHNLPNHADAANELRNQMKSFDEFDKKSVQAVKKRKSTVAINEKSLQVEQNTEAGLVYGYARSEVELLAFENKYYVLWCEPVMDGDCKILYLTGRKKEEQLTGTILVVKTILENEAQDQLAFETLPLMEYLEERRKNRTFRIKLLESIISSQ